MVCMWRRVANVHEGMIMLLILIRDCFLCIVFGVDVCILHSDVFGVDVCFLHCDKCWEKSMKT